MTKMEIVNKYQFGYLRNMNERTVDMTTVTM